MSTVTFDTFNWIKYVESYKDLKNHNINTKEKAWEHWITHGIIEKRKICLIQKKEIVNPIRVVLCAIALNEEKYIDEWIKYHLFLGFNHIYIYDNSETNTLKNKVSNNVTIIHFPGKAMQCSAYNNFVNTYKNNCNWVGFIDCDEFIVLKKHKNIVDFVKDYKDYDSIGLNWLMFGSSNEKVYKNEPVTSRFKYCSKTIDTHIKCITKINSITNINNPHYQIISGKMVDTNKQIISGPFNPKGDSNIACIHHYWTKSEQEFREKIERGRATINTKRNVDIDYNMKINNNVYNSDAWDFYLKNISK